MNQPSNESPEQYGPAPPPAYATADHGAAQGQAEQGEKTSPSAGWLLALAATTTTAIAALMLVLILGDGRSGSEYIDWLRGTNRLKLETTQGQLALERFLAGQEDIGPLSISRDFDQADRYAEALLRGPKAEIAGYPALRDPALRRQLDAVRDRLIALRQIARQRLGVLPGSETNSEAQQQGSRVLQQLGQEADKFEAMLLDARRAERARFERDVMVLVGLLLWAFFEGSTATPSAPLCAVSPLRGTVLSVGVKADPWLEHRERALRVTGESGR